MLLFFILFFYLKLYAIKLFYLIKNVILPEFFIYKNFIFTCNLHIIICFILIFILYVLKLKKKFLKNLFMFRIF